MKACFRRERKKRRKWKMTYERLIRKKQTKSKAMRYINL